MKKQLTNKFMVAALALSIGAIGTVTANGLIPQKAEATKIDNGVTSTINGHYVEVEKGVKLYVEDVGKGKPVVFVHGWPLNHTMFEPQQTFLPSHGVRFIGIDLRGYGKSDHPLKGYDFDTMAKDVHTVLNKLNLKDVTLVGYSMGGMITTHYTATYKEDIVKKLVLVGAPVPRWTESPEFPNNLKKAEVDALLEKFSTDRPGTIRGLTDGFFYSEKSPQFRQWFDQIMIDADANATISSLKALRDADFAKDLPKIKVPTLILHGVEDHAVPFYMAEAAHKAIKNSTLVPFEKSGHGINFDEKDKFNKELLKFVQR
ncbi:alpha/beta fold hydrolase [Paenibacillus gansuensis]|uniref:Alpha/beta fold hydrolase n=1 Tax=Paenibacillus gansuensis TaxID=306542 RepID=A0ABW5P7C2_9BACL